MAIRDVFGPVLDSRIHVSAEDRVVTAVLLRAELLPHLDPSLLIRAAWLIGTAHDEHTADRIVSVFADDIELLAAVCSSVVRHLGTPWDGQLRTLGVALAQTQRGRTARSILAARLCQGLQPITQKAWSLTGGGVDLLDLIDDPALLGDLIGKTSSNWRVLHRLAELGAAGVILSLARAAAGSLSAMDWSLIARPLEPAARREFLLALIGRIRADQRLLDAVQEELERIERELAAQACSAASQAD